MHKQHLLVLFTATLMAMAAPFVTAQDTPAGNAAPQASQSQPAQEQPAQEQPGQENGMRHHGFDPARRTAELTRHLNLTPDQQTKVRQTLESARSQMESVHQDSSLSQPDRHAKMMEIHRNTDAQIRGLLNATQQKKFDEMQARREHRMEERREGQPPSGAAQQGPSQQ
jgi:protein CpxP